MKVINYYMKKINSFIICMFLSNTYVLIPSCTKTSLQENLDNVTTHVFKTNNYNVTVTAVNTDRFKFCYADKNGRYTYECSNWECAKKKIRNNLNRAADHQEVIAYLKAFEKNNPTSKITINPKQLQLDPTRYYYQNEGILQPPYNNNQALVSLHPMPYQEHNAISTDALNYTMYPVQKTMCKEPGYYYQNEHILQVAYNNNQTMKNSHSTPYQRHGKYSTQKPMHYKIDQQKALTQAREFAKDYETRSQLECKESVQTNSPSSLHNTTHPKQNILIKTDTALPLNVLSAKSPESIEKHPALNTPQAPKKACAIPTRNLYENQQTMLFYDPSTACYITLFEKYPGLRDLDEARKKFDLENTSI